MEFKKISDFVIKAIEHENNLEIYYPETENNPEGWRQINPLNVSTDVPPQGEELDLKKELLSPGHILNAYDIIAKDDNLRSFILGKIKNIRFL